MEKETQPLRVSKYAYDKIKAWAVSEKLPFTQMLDKIVEERDCQ